MYIEKLSIKVFTDYQIKGKTMSFHFMTLLGKLCVHGPRLDINVSLTTFSTSQALWVRWNHRTLSPLTVVEISFSSTLTYMTLRHRSRLSLVTTTRLLLCRLSPHVLIWRSVVQCGGRRRAKLIQISRRRHLIMLNAVPWSVMRLTALTT